jgi:xanthine/uracil permease
MAKEKKNKDTVEALYSLDGKINLLKAFPFGLQHILAMFVANITPSIIVAAACGLGAKDTAMIIQSAMIIAGIGTFIQLFPIWRIGSRLPIVMGISFTFVSLACTLGAQYGYGTLMGAVLIGGIVEGLLGLFAKYWIKVISPIVAATVVTAIGFSLLSVGAASFGGGTGAPGAIGAPAPTRSTFHARILLNQRSFH